MSVTTPKPPFPPSGKYLQTIKESSKNLRIHANIKIAKESIQRLLFSKVFTSSFKRVSAVHGLDLPLKFDSHLEELNLTSVLSLLNFASGYRTPLHEQLHRGAWDTIRAFVLSLFISSTEGIDYLSAQGMKSIDVTKVAELMGIKLHVEISHERTPGILTGRLEGPLYELAESITQVLNETGSILVNDGYPNIGSFVLETLREGTAQSCDGTSSSNALEIGLERLVKTFPAFQDMSIINGQPIYCFKKALFLFHAIHVRFASTPAPPFPIPSTEQSPVFSDNVLPSLLIYLGVIDLSNASELRSLFPSAGSKESLQRLLGSRPGSETTTVGLEQVRKGIHARKIPREGPVLTNDQAFMLRAAAIDACEMIVQEARSLDMAKLAENDQESLAWICQMTLPGLDMWLWSIAKDRSDYRELERFVQRDTTFF